MGARPCFCQIGRIVDIARPTSAAMARSVRCVASPAGAERVSRSTSRTLPSGTGALPGRRVASRSSPSPLLREPLLPAPHAGLGNPRPAHDLHRAVPGRTLQNDPGAPDMLLLRIAVRGNPFRTAAVLRSDHKRHIRTHDGNSLNKPQRPHSGPSRHPIHSIHCRGAVGSPPFRADHSLHSRSIRLSGVPPVAIVQLALSADAVRPANRCRGGRESRGYISK